MYKNSHIRLSWSYFQVALEVVWLREGLPRDLSFATGLMVENYLRNMDIAALEKNKKTTKNLSMN